MAAGAGEVAAVVAGAGATGGTTKEGVGATGGAVAEVVLGPPTVGAPGVELTAGGGEFRRTHGRKE